MAHTPEELEAAIKQIRDYASTYKGKRKDFFDSLYAMLATPIPQDNNYSSSVKKMYLAAIGALTSEIQPPTAETCVEVVSRLNSALKEGELGAINIAVYPDEGMDDAYGIVGEKRSQESPTPRAEFLRDTLPKKRKLTKRDQSLIDKFRAELPSTERPFARRGQQGG